MASGLNVIFDERWREGGIGRFANEVSGRLRGNGLGFVELGLSRKIADPLGPIALWRRLLAMRGDVFWSPGFLPPVRANIPIVITMHDLIHRRYGGWQRRVYYDRVIKPLVRHVDAVMTVSEYSKRTIVEWIGEGGPPVIVVGNGVSSAFSVAGNKYQAKAPYALYCGNHRPHKNIDRMLEGFLLSQSDSSLLLGMTGVPDKTTTALIQKYRLADRVFWLGMLDEFQLAAAYRGAAFLILVSLDEGFGLPVIEAMACGTPVLCSNSTALGEVAANAALTVDPNDVVSIADGIGRIGADDVLRSKLMEEGIARATDFKWDAVADRVYGIFESVVRA